MKRTMAERKALPGQCRRASRLPQLVPYDSHFSCLMPNVYIKAHGAQVSVLSVSGVRPTR